MKPKYWELPIDCLRWITSEARRVLRLDGRGLYWELLIHQWVKGFVPDDINQIALIAAAPLREVRKAWVHVEPWMPIYEPGKRRNADMEDIRSNKKPAAVRDAEHGRAGGLAKARNAKAKLAEQPSQKLGGVARGGRDKVVGGVESKIVGGVKTVPTNSSSVVRSFVVPELDLQPTNNRDLSTGGAGDEFDNLAAFDEFRADYPKDAGLYGQEITSAWEDIVETAVNQAVIWGEVKRGLVRMNASGTPEKFIPSAAKFLRERKFLELWAPRDGRPVAKALKKCGCGEWITECVGLDCSASICPQCDPRNDWHLGASGTNVDYQDPLCGECLKETSEAIEKNKQILRGMG